MIDHLSFSVRDLAASAAFVHDPDGNNIEAATFPLELN